MNYPPQEIINPSGIEKRDFEYIILWMLNNNDECNWSDFLEKPLEISLATLSKYMNILMTNGYVEKKSKGVYAATAEGRKRYFDLRFKDSFERKLRYPPEIILNKRNYNHTILWMLCNNEYCKWSDFLEKPLSINHHSLSKNLNLLIKKGFVESENMEYRITKPGELQYSKMLKTYHLDYQTILEEDVERIEDIKKKVKNFFEKCEIDVDEIKIIFLDLVNHLDYAKIENLLPSEEDFYKILLFIALNHPIKYPECILPEEFSQKYDIKLGTLNYFVQNIVEADLYPIKFFKFAVDEFGVYYFREEEKFEKMLYLIVDENIEKFSYLNKLEPDMPDEQKKIQTINLLENILNDISNKLFEKKIKSSILGFLQEYIRFLYSKFQKSAHLEEISDKFKGLALKNLVNLDWDDIQKLIPVRRPITPLLKDFPRYTILNEFKKKYNQ
ncbi:MAG: hypothetical protein ACFE8M_11065 [Candidatus Hermodarchaeota archaeon]